MTLGHNMFHYMLWTTPSMWLPDPGPRQPTGHCLHGGNCLWSFASWVTCHGHHHLWRHNYQRVSALSVFSRHLFTCTARCNGGRTRLYDAAWSEHSAWRYWHWSVVPPVSDLSLLSPVGSHEIWNPYRVAAVATSERLNQQTIWCNRDGCGVARLEAFLYIQNCKFLTYVDVIKDAKQRMRTQNSGIHTSLVVAIRRGKMMRCEVSLNNKRRPSILLHVVGVTSSRGPHLTGRLTLTVRRGDEYSATCCQACTH